MDDYYNDHGFTTPTGDNSRPWLWTVSLLSLLYSLLALGARITSKWDLLWFDDALLGGAYIIAFAHYGTIFSAISNGLGTTVGTVLDWEEDLAAKTYFTSRILYLVAMCLSKISVLAFARRIFSGNIYFEKPIFGAALAMSIIWGVLAATLSSAGCTPVQVLTAQQDAVCPSNRARWIVIVVLDVVTELLLLAIPVWFVSKNQIKASKKRVVAFVFAFRLVVAAFAICTAVSYFTFLNGAQDNIGLSATVAWQEVLLGTSLVSASIPSLRSFLWAFMSRGMGTMYGIDTKLSTNGGSIPMRSMNKSGRSAQGSQAAADEELGEVDVNKKMSLRPDWMQYSVDVGRGSPKTTRDNRASGSMKSDSSEQMIIHRNVEFEVK
ncbi:hypothetical protein AMS68_001104 [Peltaster fructicola]|uniref:Rhodopsin domain-containing protein n=1 Tax=Peltaster fructicola TaxID=286661 RepID=A0A6H0XLF9_9PEZI|nr:hypothetical protein AMS68_001104 [Peltaster fructicola]